LSGQWGILPLDWFFGTPIQDNLMPNYSSTLNKNSREPIAVVGIGCRFPSDINSAQALWKALLEGIDAVGNVPSDRWNADMLYDPNMNRSGRINNRRGGFIKGIDKFDADFFDFFPAEAKQLDPQQRLLLEVCYEAFEDAGETLERLAGSRAGVFIGTFVYDYHTMGMSSQWRDRTDAHSVMGAGMASIANRLSYTFDLKGPSLMLDTYCSSSLVAVHLACRSIWDGDAETAIAGGLTQLLSLSFRLR
jgi:acyl transferase domain-containing protein